MLTPPSSSNATRPRWQVEVCFCQTRQDAGVGQARNRVRRVVERTVPFGLVYYSLAIVCYTASTASPPTTWPPAARWYRTKAAPSAADMLAALRRVLIATQYQQGPATAPTLLETLQVQVVRAAAQPDLQCESPVDDGVSGSWTAAVEQGGAQGGSPVADLVAVPCGGDEAAVAQGQQVA
jgi:hypothetical protein